MIKKEIARIAYQKEIYTNIYSMWIDTDIASSARAGQFISVFIKDKSKLLPRPISICQIDRKAKSIRIVYRVTGKNTGTYELSKMRPGNKIEIMGPLGNGFPLDTNKDKKVLVVGGGIGIPPLVQLAAVLAEIGQDVHMVMGYKHWLYLTEELRAFGRLSVATEAEYITRVLSKVSECITAGNVMDVINKLNIVADIIYACGPTPMLKAVSEYGKEIGATCYISIEEKMACGIGACLACVCNTTKKDQHSNLYKQRVCKEGPVFLSTEVVL